MGKRATAKDVALVAGVSKWTVIRAFTPGASIAEASRQKVLVAARQLSYSPNLLAHSLATNLTHQVALFVDDFTNPHKLPFLEKLTGQLQAAGLIAMLVNINQHFSHVHALLNAGQRQVDAIILCGTAFRDETLNSRNLDAGSPPMFVLARNSQIEDVPAVNCDAELAMQEMGAYFLAKGYRKPGFMKGAQTLSTALGRQRNFKLFWHGHGVRNIAEFSAQNYSAEAGAAAIRQYLAETPAADRIDLLMCENDILAVGAIDIIRSEFGLRVPQDIAVAGFDDVPLAAAPAYDLTTYQQPIDAMVTAVVEMILGKRERATIQMHGKLVVRSSA